MKLIYFAGHGRGLPLRMILDYCNAEFEDERVKFEEFMPRKLAGEFAPFG